jgi:hypothetical protein
MVSRSTYKSEEGEEQVDELVDKLDVQEDLAPYSMIRIPDLSKVEQRVHGREERSV